MHNKKYYTLEDIITYRNLYVTAGQCESTVPWKNSAVFFNQNKEYFIPIILKKFYEDNEYDFAGVNHFIVNERGKKRLISNNTFRDRVVLTTFNKYFMLPAFAPTFIYDNGASLTGRGIDFSLRRMEHYLHSMYSKYGTDFYYIKMDIRKYFDSMYHPYILNLIQKNTKDERIIKFFRDYFRLFEEDPLVGNGTPGPVGLGLGSTIVQTCGLLYLNELDHYIKEHWHIKAYVRYMDDMIILHPDKEYLKKLLEDVKEYTQNRLKMELHPDKTCIEHIHRGLVFLKIHYYLRENGTLYKKPAMSTVYRIRRKLYKLKRLQENNPDYVSDKDIQLYYSSVRGCLMRADSESELNWLDSIYTELTGMTIKTKTTKE